VVALLMLLSLVVLGEGAPGDLDSTFGVRGKVTTDFGGFASASALVLQPDGKLVAAGGTFRFTLARYLPDGSLDTTFGTGGKVTTDFGHSDLASALVLQPDGKLVAAGETRQEDVGALDFALARYLPDGSLDPTFGTGGKVTTDFGVFSQAFALVRQPDSKLVAAGGTAGGFALARYLPDGSLDPTFGTSGKVTTDFGERASALVLQPDGKLVAVGGISAFALARYLPDGSLDPIFGTGGKVTTNFGGQDMGLALVRQPDGKLVAAGGSNAGGIFEFALVHSHDKIFC
jgi:uncharacterized delta-60 repeat protein